MYRPRALRQQFSIASTIISLTAVVLMTVSVHAGNDIKINSDVSGSVQNEVRIAVNPNNTNQIVTAYNDGAGSGSNTLGISYSGNGGATWTDTQIPTAFPMHPNTGGTLDNIFDPYIAYDNNNTVYAGYIARPSTLVAPTVAVESGLYIHSSTNGGATWSGPTLIESDVSTVMSPDPTYRFNDRPEIAIGSANDIGIAWIKDVGVNQPFSDIYFSHSPSANPGPLNFTTPVIVNDNSAGNNPMPPPTSDRGIAPDIVFQTNAANAANNKIYVAWIDYDVTISNSTTATFKIDSTTVGAVNTPMTAGFGGDITLQDAGGIITIDPLPRRLSTATALQQATTPDDARAQSYPVIALDPSDQSGNTIYLAFAAEVGPKNNVTDEGDIFFTRSIDGGGSWTSPVAINDDNTTFDQMHPVIDVKTDGTIDIAWYDKRNSTNDDAWDVYITRSTDGGNSFFPNLRVTDQSFLTTTDTANLGWLGEYFGLDVVGDTAYLSFTSRSGIDPTTQMPSSPDQLGDVFFDAIPNSEIAIPLPATGTMGLVLLAGFGAARRGRRDAAGSSHTWAKPIGLCYFIPGSF